MRPGRLSSIHGLTLKVGRRRPEVLKSALSITADKATRAQVVGEEEEALTCLHKVRIKSPALESDLGIGHGVVVLDVFLPTARSSLDVLVRAQLGPSDAKVYGELVNDRRRGRFRRVVAAGAAIGVGSLGQGKLIVGEGEPLRLVAAQGGSILREFLLFDGSLRELAGALFSGPLLNPRARLAIGRGDIAGVLLDQNHAGAILPLVFWLFDLGRRDDLVRTVEVDCCLISGALSTGECRVGCEDGTIGT